MYLIDFWLTLNSVSEALLEPIRQRNISILMLCILMNNKDGFDWFLIDSYLGLWSTSLLVKTMSRISSFVAASPGSPFPVSIARHVSVVFSGQTGDICRLYWTDSGHLSSLVDRQAACVVFSGQTGRFCRLQWTDRGHLLSLVVFSGQTGGICRL